MSFRERRQHFRIEDQIYFSYLILDKSNCYYDKFLPEDLLGQFEQRYVETMDYFQRLDYELARLTQTLALRDPVIAHYLNLMNAKIDYFVRQLGIGNKVGLHRVTLSLGGMSFKAKERIKEKTPLKMAIYTKPKMIPIIINAIVVYCRYQSSHSYRVAVQFENLTAEQEQLLSQHIMLAQVPC